MRTAGADSGRAGPGVGCMDICNALFTLLPVSFPACIRGPYLRSPYLGVLGCIHDPDPGGLTGRFVKHLHQRPLLQLALVVRPCLPVHYPIDDRIPDDYIPAPTSPRPNDERNIQPRKDANLISWLRLRNAEPEVVVSGEEHAARAHGRGDVAYL